MSRFLPRRHMRTRTKLALTIALALMVGAMVPGPARAGIAGTPIPNPVDVIGGGLGDLAGGALGDVVPQLIHAVIKTLFGGVSGKLGLAIVKWLVSHPDLTSPRYHELAQLRGYVSDAATGMLTLVLVASAMRFWVSGYTSSGASEGAQALARAALAAALLVAYPYFIADALKAANLFTAALLSSHGVVSGTQHMFNTALALQIAGGPAGAGLGLIAAVIAFVILILLIVSKIVLATLLAILYVLAPLAIVLWPLPETSWVGRVFVQGLFAVIVWPLVWCLCFAVFAVMGKSALTVGTDHGLVKLIEPFIAVAALYVAFKLPRIIAQQATTVGVLPNIAHTAWTLSSVRNVISSRGGSARAAGPTSGAVGGGSAGGGAARGAAAAGEVAGG